MEIGTRQALHEGAAKSVQKLIHGKTRMDPLSHSRTLVRQRSRYVANGKKETSKSGAWAKLEAKAPTKDN
jgi:hypothetical protein